MFKLHRRNESLLTLDPESTLAYTSDDELCAYALDHKAVQQKLERQHSRHIHQHNMNTNVQTPATGQKAYRYTGFNEPFSNDRNTTWAHPDADTSPNATIEAPDFNLARTHTRGSFRSSSGKQHHSHTFRNPLNRNKHSAGATSIGSDLSTMYDNIQYADGSIETQGNEEIEKEAEKREEVVSMNRQSSKGMPGLISELSVQKRRTKLSNDSGVDMGMDSSERMSDDESRSEKKRKGLLGKLGL